ncbi:helix-turn-helix domain-containing protein [Kocuria sp. CPCC 205300]|uniref:helix-turn-helix domain-containing protein n=1 Tax=Kocuria sabuli TaxID=3071448 RepID=UPI0036DD5CA6
MKELELGGTGRTVRDNVKRLRGGMQYKELSEKLDKLGHSIPPLGLRRIENGARRVTVDDLTALAAAFNVSPLTLLLPEDGSRFAASWVTGVPNRPVGHNTQWLWGLGEEPLELNGIDETDRAHEVARFRGRSKPPVDERGERAWVYYLQPDGSRTDPDAPITDEQLRHGYWMLFTQGFGKDLLDDAADPDAGWERWPGKLWEGPPYGDD